MINDVEIELGEQPIAKIMVAHDLKPHDLVAALPQQLTHKMVAKACKGRRLTPNVQTKIRSALNHVTHHEYAMAELFTY